MAPTRTPPACSPLRAPSQRQRYRKLLYSDDGSRQWRDRPCNVRRVAIPRTVVPQLAPAPLIAPASPLLLPQDEEPPQFEQPAIEIVTVYDSDEELVEIAPKPAAPEERRPYQAGLFWFPPPEQQEKPKEPAWITRIRQYLASTRPRK